MKILSGKHKNKTIEVPKKFVRPTSGMVKEAMFNILEYSYGGLDGKNVLDICCGSGALGLEALSRGAGRAKFIDNNRRGLETVKQNADKLGELEQCEFICCYAEQVRFSDDEKYGVVFIDPPYEKNIIPKIMQKLPPVLADEHIIIVEQRNREALDISDDFELLKKRNYGDTHILFYKFCKTNCS